MKKILAFVLALALFSCSREQKECSSPAEKTFPLSGFTRISAGETFALQVKQGAVYAIKAKGCADDLADLALTAGSDGTVTVAYNRFRRDRNPLDLELTLPSLEKLTLAGAAFCNVNGFHQQAAALRLEVAGAAKCTVDGLPLLVHVNGSGTGAVTLVSTLPDLIAKLSGDGRLKAYGATISDADVYTAGTAWAQVAVQQSLVAIASGDSRIYYKGNPRTVNAEQSGTAKVIKE